MKKAIFVVMIIGCLFTLNACCHETPQGLVCFGCVPFPANASETVVDTQVVDPASCQAESAL